MGKLDYAAGERLVATPPFEWSPTERFVSGSALGSLIDAIRPSVEVQSVLFAAYVILREDKEGSDLMNIASSREVPVAA